MWAFSFLVLVAASRVNPVEKVTTLLAKLQAEVEAEGKAEAAAYDKYACFCKEQASNKQYAIEKFVEQENVLNGKISDKTARKAKLDDEVSQHNQDVTTLEGEQEAAQGIRTGEADAYTARAAQLASAIKAMKGAIESLSASKGEMKNAKVELLGKYTDVIKSSVVLAEGMNLVTNGPEILKLLQQPANVYSYQSNEIIATLESLLKTFKSKKIQADNEEQTYRQDFGMASGARHNQIKSLQKSASEKASASAALEEEINENSSDLAATEAAHAADQNFLNDLVTSCEKKASDYDQRSSTRANELSAISKALELLKGDVAKMFPATNLGLVAGRSSVGKAAGGHWQWIPDAPAAPAAPAAPVKVATVNVAADDDDDDSDDNEGDDDGASFLQIKHANHKGIHKKLIGFLTKRAEALKSMVLSTLLMKLRDAPSPFAKVKQMINDLVTRLENEAEDEASQKGWCDGEMTKTTAARDTAQRNIEDYNALHTEKNALVDQLTEQIATLSQEIADLNKALNEQTELRNTEKLANDKTVADSQAGLDAVSQAIDFLQDFYGTSLLQQKPGNAAEGYERFAAEGAGSDGKTVADMAPDAGGVSGEYGGKTDASKSIIGLLEVIKSDFENAVSTTQADEDAAQATYDTFKADTETDIGDKTTLKGDKETERTNAELDITQAEADLKTEHEQLQLALDELLKLKPVCVDSGMSWEERSARRKQEIESLKEALKILQNTDFGFLQQ